MALLFKTLIRRGHSLQNITKPATIYTNKYFAKRIINTSVCRKVIIPSSVFESNSNLCACTLRYCTTQSSSDGNPPKQEPLKKPGLVQKFKQMSKDYWYVVLPVHLTTSAIWFGSFYYCVRSGVDVVSVLESLGISEKLITPIKESTAGYFALAFALYKLATPLRYAVTVGGTTFAIKKLTTIGWIKPMPSPERIKEMIQEKKENIQDRFTESKQHYQTQIKEKSTQVMDEMRRYKTEVRNAKNKMKKIKRKE